MIGVSEIKIWMFIMNLFTKRSFFIIGLLIPFAFSQASALVFENAAGPGPGPGPGPAPKADPNVVAENCRQAALKIDFLGRYQDRTVCTQNLDGSQMYFASKYVLAGRYADATSLVSRAIIQTGFAVDILCYGQDDLKKMVTNLQSIQADIATLS